MIPGILLMLGAIVGFSLALWVKRSASEQFGWPQAAGTVTGSEHGFMTSYHALIDYTFYFKDRMYGGNRVASPQGFANLPGVASGVHAKYPKGAKVTVYVNPEDPELSVLEPGGDRTFIPTAAFFALLAWGIGAKMVYLAI